MCQHNNARLHVAQPVVYLFIDYAWETLHHPPYSPNLSPADFDLFPKLKEPLRGTCFGSLDEFSLAVIREVGTVHDCRSTNIVGIGNVNTVLLNGKIVIFKSF